MKKILVTNDDGIRSEGLKILSMALMSLGEVYVVAPDRERSAVSHSLTLFHPLRVEQLKENVFAVNGTPTDCVNLAVNGILKQKPDIIVSGINKGGNLGEDITYSGTVSAAIEGVLLNIPSIAVSLVAKNNFDFSYAASFTVKLVKALFKKKMASDTLLNVNIPGISENEIRGVKFTRQGKRIYGSEIVEKTDPRGRKYYWIGGDELGYENIKDSDILAINEGYISITPIHLDMTNYALLKKLEKWKI